MVSQVCKTCLFMQSNLVVFLTVNDNVDVGRTDEGICSILHLTDAHHPEAHWPFRALFV